MVIAGHSHDPVEARKTGLKHLTCLVILWPLEVMLAVFTLFYKIFWKMRFFQGRFIKGITFDELQQLHLIKLFKKFGNILHISFIQI